MERASNSKTCTASIFYLSKVQVVHPKFANGGFEFARERLSRMTNVFRSLRKHGKERRQTRMAQSYFVSSGSFLPFGIWDEPEETIYVVWMQQLIHMKLYGYLHTKLADWQSLLGRNCLWYAYGSQLEAIARQCS